MAHGSGTAVGLCTTAPDNGLLSFHKARHELAYEVSRSSTPGDARKRNERLCHNNNKNNKKTCRNVHRSSALSGSKSEAA